MKVVENNNAELKYHAIVDGFAALFTEESKTSRPSCDEILKVSCEVHNIFPDLLKTKSRKGDLVRVRQQYCLVAYLFKHIYRVIGEKILRDHVTVISAKRKAIIFYRTEEEYRDEVNLIISRFPLYVSTLMERLLNLTKT